MSLLMMTQSASDTRRPGPGAPVRRAGVSTDQARRAAGSGVAAFGPGDPRALRAGLEEARDVLRRLQPALPHQREHLRAITDGILEEVIDIDAFEVLDAIGCPGV